MHTAVPCGPDAGVACGLGAAKSEKQKRPGACCWEKINIFQLLNELWFPGPGFLTSSWVLTNLFTVIFFEGFPKSKFYEQQLVK